MTEKIYKVRCVDGKLYLVHHGVSDYIGLDDQSTNEKAIIQISHYLNEQEERIKNLKETIIKITIAYQRKHDNTIVNLIDEVWEEDISDLIKEYGCGMTDRYGDKYRVHNWVKFDYSDIGEYIDENHTDRPLRSDIVIDLLNEQNKRIKELENELELYKHYVEFVPSSGDVDD